MVISLLLLLLQDRVDLPDFKTSYQVTRPAAYTDRESWPVIVDLNTGKDPLLEPDAFVLVPAEKKDEASILGCVADLKTKYRVNPELVIVRGGAAAMSLASTRPDVIAGCILYRPLAFTPPKRLPPCVVLVDRADPDRINVVAAAMAMKKRGLDVEVRGATDRALPAILAKLHPKEDVQKADEYQRAGRYCDASLVCIGLLENPKTEWLAKTKLKSIEGAAIMELAKVEVAMADKKYKDAILRCREAARQFAWVPPGERIRKRLGELERRPEVLRALETED